MSETLSLDGFSVWTGMNVEFRAKNNVNAKLMSNIEFLLLCETIHALFTGTSI